MATQRLEGKVALVTGAASGFGAAIAARFSEEGCAVLLTDINEDGLRTQVTRMEESADARVAWLCLDVTDGDAWSSAVRHCLDRWQRLDICVNNAGTTYKNKDTLLVEEKEFELVFAVNVKSVFHSVLAVVPTMKRLGGGSIINISSIGSVRPRPGLVWYNSSKGAVTNATKGLAAEFGPFNIRVNAIAPLLSGTGLFESFVGVPDTPENRANFTANVPLGRLTDPLDVANAALFLASDESRFVTGINMDVDGGRAV